MERIVRKDVKIRVLLRHVQEIPYENAERQKEMEHKSDLAALRLGIPLPTRYRPFLGEQRSNIRIHEREYDSIAEFFWLHDLWERDEECQALHRQWQSIYNWERRELYYVDDVSDPIIPWIQMAAEQGRTVRYVVNPDYKMAKDQIAQGKGGESQ